MDPDPARFDPVTMRPTDDETLLERGSWAVGPPWILGHRGSPTEAPENTLASLERALELGLDGIEYDLQRCATGEAVLLHDETLERTTDGSGPVVAWTLPELSRLDAGGWFDRRFAGEPLPLLEEALALSGPAPGSAPVHMIELKDPALVREVGRALAELPRPFPVRVASFHRSVCQEARDAGLPTMLLAVAADEEDRRFVRDEGLAAYGVSARGWRTSAGAGEWTCERWAWSVDDPADLYEACRRPLSGINTNEPLRALSVRALCTLAPEDRGPYPLAVPSLEVVPGAMPGTRGEWCGRWAARASVRNPFAWRAAVELDLEARGGAYRVHGLPLSLSVAPGGAESFEFRLEGGSWSPGADPLLTARYAWRRSEGPPPGRLLLDAPLRRVRTLVLSEGPRRIWLLRERRSDPEASMVVRRQGRFLVCSIEGAGRLEEPRAVVHLAGETRRGAVGVRVPLRDGLTADLGPLRSGPGGRAGPRGPGEGIPFACGIEGLEPSPEGPRPRVRRWSGGLPEGPQAGAPGRLVLRGRG